MPARLHAANPALPDIWKQCCRFLDGESPGPKEKVDSAVVHQRLLRITESHPGDEDHVQAVLCSVYRGVPLLLAALSWRQPRAGGSAESTSLSDGRRGEQWRLVMGYGGFESVISGLLAYRGRGLGSPQFEALLARCDLPAYPLLEAPKLTNPIREKWLAIGSAGKADVLLRFLRVEKGDARAISDWLVHGQPVDSWVRALGLAKALRNATAHGALSANKVKEWKLQTAFRVLVENLGQVVAAVLVHLIPE